MKILLAAILTIIAAGFVSVVVRRPQSEYPLARATSPRLRRAETLPAPPSRQAQAAVPVSPGRDAATYFSLEPGGRVHGQDMMPQSIARPAFITRRLFDAMRWVESNDDDRAIGDGGRSVGPYQCGRAAWLDGGGRAEDYPWLAHDRAVTEAVMVRYWQRYGAVTDEDKAKCWNVGPRWRTRARAAGDGYWRKVNVRIKEK